MFFHLLSELSWELMIKSINCSLNVSLFSTNRCFFSFWVRCCFSSPLLTDPSKQQRVTGHLNQMVCLSESCLKKNTWVLFYKLLHFIWFVLRLILLYLHFSHVFQLSVISAFGECRCKWRCNHGGTYLWRSLWRGKYYMDQKQWWKSGGSRKQDRRHGGGLEGGQLLLFQQWGILPEPYSGAGSVDLQEDYQEYSWERYNYLQHCVNLSWYSFEKC